MCEQVSEGGGQAASWPVEGFLISTSTASSVYSNRYGTNSGQTDRPINGLELTKQEYCDKL